MDSKIVKGGREIIKEIEFIESQEEIRPANKRERKRNLIAYKRDIVNAGKEYCKELKQGDTWQSKLGYDIGVSDSTINDLLRLDAPARNNEDIVKNMEKRLGFPKGFLTRVHDKLANWGDCECCYEYNVDEYREDKKKYYELLREFFKKNDVQSCSILVEEMPIYLKLPLSIQKRIMECADKLTLCDYKDEEKMKYLRYKRSEKYCKSRLQIKLKLKMKEIECFYPINYDIDALKKFFEFIVVDKKSVLRINAFWEKIKNSNTCDKELLKELLKYSL